MTLSGAFIFESFMGVAVSRSNTVFMDYTMGFLPVYLEWGVGTIVNQLGGIGDVQVMWMLAGIASWSVYIDTVLLTPSSSSAYVSLTSIAGSDASMRGDYLSLCV